MNNRRSIFKRALAGVAALVGIPAALPATPEILVGPKSYTLYVHFSNGAVLGLRDIVKIWQGLSKPAPCPDGPYGQDGEVMHLVTFCQDTEGREHSINMRDVVSISYGTPYP